MIYNGTFGCDGTFNCSGCTSLKNFDGAPANCHEFNAEGCTGLTSLKGLPKTIDDKCTLPQSVINKLLGISGLNIIWSDRYENL